MIRHRNIPIFIPHMGCPNQCVFCNQRLISGTQSFCEEAVPGIIERALATIPADEETEIAFFGGSFTGIDRGLMIRLLSLAEGYVAAGKVRSIRLSTRPDYVDDDILQILSSYSVRHIELGLQSMDDRVLKASGRGHTADRAAEACRKIVNAGFRLTGQMMIGLPASTIASEIETARAICRLGAESARIYPTVVFAGTTLAEWTKTGIYQPLTLDEAVRRSAAVLSVFREAGVECIRIGLCAGEDLTSPQSAVAGPNHPALGELVLSEAYYSRLVSALRECGLIGTDVVLFVPAGEVSHAVGQHRCNIERLLRETGTRIRKTVGDNSQTGIHFEPFLGNE